MSIFRRTTATIAAAAALTIGIVGCGGDEPDPIPSTSPSASTSASPSASPSVDQDAWKKKYTPKQIQAYEAALQRWEDFESRSEPIWAKGKATPAAEELFREYLPSPKWRIEFMKLETYEKAEVKTTGTPDVLWSRATFIAKGSTSVQIRQCIDYRAMTTTQHGEPTKPIASRQRPVLRELNLSKPEGYDWLIYGINEAANGKELEDKPCNPDE